MGAKQEIETSGAPRRAALHDDLPLPRGPWRWLLVFGPGAIVASLTIGTGELIFSTRGGAIFGYRILFLFAIISLLKWGLVVGSARHLVLTGVHPYQRMLDLPGPRGWFLLALLLVAALCLPIWISFHSGVLGNLTSWVTGTRTRLGGGTDYLWGAGLLTIVLILTAAGGYRLLERVQMGIVGIMVLCAAVTLFLYHPNWLEMLRGLIVPQPYAYPPWLFQAYARIAEQPVWVETTRYVGVIGGAAFDYMAYTSFVRDKGWGEAAAGPAGPKRLARIANDPTHPTRRWVRAPMIDSAISFAIVILFSGVFVASGAMILGPHHLVPDENNLLNLQARFVTAIHPWLLPLYIIGAFLTMLGTLYGTLEVACSISAELALSVSRSWAIRYRRRIRLATVAWCAVGAYGILAWLFMYQATGSTGKPRLLLAILTPANLFTGVLGCGLLCLLNLWIDRRFTPAKLRMPVLLALLNLVAGLVFLVLGAKGYWDDASRWYSIGVLIGLSVLGWIGAAWIGRVDLLRTGRM